jgi:hypothetical protein
MTKETQLSILQVNIRNSKTSLQQLQYQGKWDLLLVQEPLKDKENKTISLAGYNLVYKISKESWVATYISKKLDIAKWEQVFDTHYH